MLGLILLITFFVLLIGIFRRTGRAPKARVQYTTRWSRAYDKRCQDAQINIAARNAIELAMAQAANDRSTR